MEDKVWLDQNELAERWHRSPRTLENWRTDRHKSPIPYYKIAGKILYKMSDVLEVEKKSLVEKD